MRIFSSSYSLTICNRFFLGGLGPCIITPRQMKIQYNPLHTLLVGLWDLPKSSHVVPLEFVMFLGKLRDYTVPPKTELHWRARVINASP